MQLWPRERNAGDVLKVLALDAIQVGAVHRIVLVSGFDPCQMVLVNVLNMYRLAAIGCHVNQPIADNADHPNSALNVQCKPIWKRTRTKLCDHLLSAQAAICSNRKP